VNARDRGPGRIVRGAAAGVVTTAAERAVSFLVFLYCARTLPAPEFGIYAFLLAARSIVQMVADQGIEVVAVSALARTPARQTAIVSTVLGLRFLLWSGVAVPLAWLVLPLLAPNTPGLVPVAVVAGLLIVPGASTTYRSLYRARGDMRRFGAVALADACLGAAAVIAALALSPGLTGLFAARAAASLVVTAVAAAVEWRRVPLTVRFPGAVVGELLGGASVLAANGVMLALAVRVGHMVVMSVSGPEAVAYLGAAARIGDALGLLPEGVMLAVFPLMAAAPERLRPLATETTRLLAFIVLGMVVICATGAAEVTTLLYGSGYSPASQALRILVWGGVFSAAGAVILHSIVAVRAQRVLLPANAAASVLAFCLQAALVPRFGIAGSALATVAAMACGQLFLLGMRESRPHVWIAWRGAAAPLALAVAVVAVVGLLPSGWFRIGLGAALYAGLGAALGIVGRADWHALRAAAVARRRP
jgi:O-antigen/teichoic acid export membrane protein